MEKVLFWDYENKNNPLLPQQSRSKGIKKRQKIVPNAKLFVSGETDVFA